MNLNINTNENNHNIYKNTNEFEYNIIKYLQQNPFVRKRELVEYLRTEYNKKRGYSVENINRKLADMEKKGIIIILRYNELERFGIKEDDKRSRYVTLKRTEKIAEHLDSVINKVTSANPIQQKMALKEIEKYRQRYVLTPKQLDILVSQLNTEDIPLVEHILRIVYTYVDKKGIEPFNESEIIQMLRRLLSKYPEPLTKYKNLRTHIIYLLGHYNDISVIERLKRDAETLDNLHNIIGDYESDYTANIIEENREDLYNFEEKLRLEGRDEPAQFIAEIRVRALIHLGLHDDPLKDSVRGW
jgi:hypothetical protein